MGPASFQWCPMTGQGAMGTEWAQVGTQEVPPQYEEKLLPCEGARAVAQAAQGGCGVSFLETFKTCLDAFLCPLL